MANYYQGATWQGTVSLRVQDPVNPAKQDPYTPPSGAIYQMNFPGISPSGSVTIASSTALPSPFTGNEIAVVGGSTTDINFTVIPSKSGIVNPGKSQSIDVIVMDATGEIVNIFELSKVLTVLTKANP